MELSTKLTDGIVRPRPFRLDDVGRVFEAVRESLGDPRPLSRFHLKMIRSVPGLFGNLRENARYGGQAKSL